MSRKFSIYLLVTSSLLFWRKEYINIEEPLYIYTNLYLTSWRAQCCPWTFENLSIHPHTHTPTHTQSTHTRKFQGSRCKDYSVRFTKVPLKPLLDHECERYCCFSLSIYIKYTLDLTKVLILPLWIGNFNLCTKGHLKLRLQSL